MPRRKSPPRLYLDPKRKQWVIRDGANFVRTGRSEPERVSAEKLLAKYLGQKHSPQPSGDPLMADVLNAYAREHVPHIAGAVNTAYNIEALADFWADKKVSEVTAKNCRTYIASKSKGGARRDLETMRAAVNYWHREYGPLPVVPKIVLPPRSQPRQRWLTRSEVARLLWAARRTQHLTRAILIGVYTGSRPGVILRMQWDQVDLEKGVMARSRPEEATHKNKRAPMVRLGNRILTHLRRWKRLDGGMVKYLCHYNGARVTKLRRSWAAARERAGLDESVTPHTLRHTRATWLMQDGVDAWQAAGALGMSLEVLEKTYGHHHPDWQKRAAEV